MTNHNSLDTICASLAHAFGIPAPEKAAKANADLVNYIDKIFGGEKADRIVMYNPDAIAQWIYEKYSELCRVVTQSTDIKVPLASVMNSLNRNIS